MSVNNALSQATKAQGDAKTHGRVNHSVQDDCLLLDPRVFERAHRVARWLQLAEDASASTVTASLQASLLQCYSFMTTLLILMHKLKADQKRLASCDGAGQHLSGGAAREVAPLVAPVLLPSSLERSTGNMLTLSLGCKSMFAWRLCW